MPDDAGGSFVVLLEDIQKPPSLPELSASAAIIRRSLRVGVIEFDSKTKPATTEDSSLPPYKFLSNVITLPVETREGSSVWLLPEYSKSLVLKIRQPVAAQTLLLIELTMTITRDVAIGLKTPDENGQAPLERRAKVLCVGWASMQLSGPLAAATKASAGDPSRAPPPKPQPLKLGGGTIFRPRALFVSEPAKGAAAKLDPPMINVSVQRAPKEIQDMANFLPSDVIIPSPFCRVIVPYRHLCVTSAEERTQVGTLAEQRSAIAGFTRMSEAPDSQMALIECFDGIMEAKRNDLAARGPRYSKEPTHQEQAAALQPALIAASLLGGAGSLPPFEATTTEALEQRAITLSCYAEMCGGDSKRAQELLCRDEERIAFAPVRA